ncbi:leucine-rich repeat domain-containing protein [Acinetobacter haemolyticus]|uniref:leucine-rich repeat domain-containing protein n=1 Tax=Acinetobacter haemolyticus TaxID=29430 RepID=UPI000F73E998|nr:leucine-rich repeat domain-containing protein [Acinetobacter haemolyticus]RSN77896.1 leucine-rich repeat domain-containing protein [Acinetobacter haemolyticus]
MIEDLSNNPTFLASSNLISFCLAAAEIIDEPWDIEYVLNGETIREVTGDPIPEDYLRDQGAGKTSLIINNTIASIGAYAFTWWRDCTSLTIPNSVTTIGISSFYGWESCTSLIIPDGVTTINEYAFYQWTSCTSLTIPNSVTIIYGNAFANWPSCTSITCLAVSPPILVQSAFLSTNNAPIYVPVESVDAYKSASGWSDHAIRIFAIP